MVFDDFTPDVCYQAMKSHDLRFDGRFFVGVASTGIYCRPICRVRLPRQQNCHFYPSAAAAEQAGFRPCLRCRPELAPGFAASEASQRLARTAARMIEEGIASEIDLPTVAQRIGVTDRHLRRIFSAEFGVSPVQFAQTHRLLLAKRLLTDTRLPVAHVAQASGFSSVRRMNALFVERYRFSPTRLRREGVGASQRSGQGASVGLGPGAADALCFLLPYRPPYDFARMLAFLRLRAVPGVEAVAADIYRRVLSIDAPAGRTSCWLEVTDLPQARALQLRFDAAHAGATQSVLARVKQVFDLAADPAEIAAVLGPLAHAAEGLRLPGAFDAFELALRAILGQQVTVKAARTLAERFVDAFGEPVITPFADVTRRFPDALRVSALSRDDIGGLGIVGQRAEAMIALARALVAGELDLSPGAEPGHAIEVLCRIRGIGPWTAHYIAMRALVWPDAWLPGDVALQNALGLPNTTTGHRLAQTQAHAWRPWRSYAVLHLWRTLEQPAAPEMTR